MPMPPRFLSFGDHAITEGYFRSTVGQQGGMFSVSTLSATQSPIVQDEKMNRQLLRSGLRVLTFAAIAAALPVAAEAQTQRVSGRVTSPELAPLVGAVVQVRGTTVRATTNASGNYTIVAPTPNDVLVFSTLGYQTLEEPVNGRAIVDVTLQAQAIGLAGVVVVGYGTQTRATVSGSVSSVTATELERTSGTSTAEALVGKLQGINTRLTTAGAGTTGGRAAVGTDGRPGAATGSAAAIAAKVKTRSPLRKS
jgi:hypothetical protein